MSYNGSGTFNINTSGQPVVTGTVISSTVFNAFTADIGTGLSTAICKDGQTTATLRIPFALGINSTLTTDSTSISTGSILTAGGAGITKALWVGGLANVAGAVTLQAGLTVSAGAVALGAGTFTVNSINLKPASTTWTPTLNSFTVVNGTGAISAAGTFFQIGSLVFWECVITGTGTATVASTANTSNVSGIVAATAAVAVESSDVNIQDSTITFTTGGGFVNADGNIYPTTWSAKTPSSTGRIVISGHHRV